LWKLLAVEEAVFIIIIFVLLVVITIFFRTMELRVVLVEGRAAITILVVSSLVGQVLPGKVLPVAINRHQLLAALAAAARLLLDVLRRVQLAAMVALEKLHLYLVEHMRVAAAAAQKHTLAEQAEQVAVGMDRRVV
jgi:hypothetical protein